MAFSVSQGIHGRRRAGLGETFWQFRTYEQSDAANLIDWRRSAGTSHLYVREREWEAAHTVWFFVDTSPSMLFASQKRYPLKAERAIVLALALACLLCEAGERVGLPGLMEPKAGRKAPQVMMERLQHAVLAHQGLPEAGMKVSKHSELVILSDFLEPEAELKAKFSDIARHGARALTVHILDRAEETFPYEGRIDFLEIEGRETFRAERAQGLRSLYQRRLAAHKAAIAVEARRNGWTPFLHHTDRPAAEVLLALHMHLSGLGKSYRAKGQLARLSLGDPQGNGASGGGSAPS